MNASISKHCRGWILEIDYSSEDAEPDRAYVPDIHKASVGCDVEVQVGMWGVCAGLKTFASVQSTRQLSEHTSAGLGATWQPGVGLGLQLVSSRELSDNTSADFNWVIGPAGAAGAGISVSRRGEKFTTTGRIEVRARTPAGVDVYILGASWHGLLRPQHADARFGAMLCRAEFGVGHLALLSGSKTAWDREQQGPAASAMYVKCHDFSQGHASWIIQYITQHQVQVVHG